MICEQRPKAARRPTDAERFMDLALEHLEAVHRLAVLLSPSLADAADLTMMTYTIASRAADRFERQQLGLRPWLLKLLAAACRRRRRGTVLRSADGPPPPGTSHPDVAMKRAIERLPRMSRAILLLWSVENLASCAIADVLGLPVGSVIRRLHRARRLVAEAMDRSRV